MAKGRVRGLALFIHTEKSFGGSMKRIAIFALGLLSLGALLYAQEGDSPGQDSRRPDGFDEYQRTSIEKLSLSGTLGLKRGVIILKDGDRIWYAPGLRPFAGFIDGLKDGAAVTLEGWGRRIPQTDAGFLRVSKLILDGKEYEVGPAEPWITRGSGLWEKFRGRGDPLGLLKFRDRRWRGWAEPGWGLQCFPDIRRHLRTRPKEN
jgi:hypothetical protein